MDENKYNYYYQKVIRLRTTKKRTDDIPVKKVIDIFPWEKEAIKKGLKNILNNNYEHLLTDSFLDYISTDSTMGFNYESLSGDENSVLYLLSFYFQSITGQYTFTPNNKNSKFGFVRLLDGELKEATHDLYEYQHKSTEYKLDNALNCLLAYCFMNQCIDKFKGYCDQIFSNPNELLDYIDLNKFLDGPDGWYTFTKNYVNEHLNGKIKVIR